MSSTGPTETKPGHSLLSAGVRLRQGDAVLVHSRGTSMEPHVKDGQLVRLRPVADGEVLEPGMIVLARVKRSIYLHFVRMVNKKTGAVLIGNARGHVNGWASRANVFGVLEEKL